MFSTMVCFVAELRRLENLFKEPSESDRTLDLPSKFQVLLTIHRDGSPKVLLKTFFTLEIAEPK